MDDDRVARKKLQLLPLERLLQIGYRDLVGVAEHLHAFERRDVEHHAAREERRRVLHPELGEARARCDLTSLEAVVVRIAVGLMREAVELRADLADFTGHDFLVAAARVPSGIHEGALGMQVENARAEEGHAGPEDVAELDHLAGLDETRAAQYGLGILHMVPRAALVARAPFRRAALAFGGYVPLRECERGSGKEGDCDGGPFHVSPLS